MTEFRKYTHIERLGSAEVDGLLEGEVWVFPKIDGTNASLWLDETGALQAGSRTRHLSAEEDNAGFYEASLKSVNFDTFFDANPTLRLYGEWLVPHSLKTYQEDAWRKFYVFDVMEGDRFLHYNEYSPLLEFHGIDYVPPIFFVKNPTKERMANALEQNSFLIKAGAGPGEGVVIKNYAFVNRFGRTAWAKIVTNEFKAKHTKALGPREVTEKIRIEDGIAADFVTKSLVDKVYAKIVTEKDGWSSRDIPRLLNTVYYDLIREEIWEILKKYKSPSIDFGLLQKCVFAHTKVYRPDIF